MSLTTRSALNVIPTYRRRVYLSPRTITGAINTDLSTWITVPVTTSSTFSPENDTVAPTFITPVAGVQSRTRTYASGNIQLPLIPNLMSALVPSTLRGTRAEVNWTPSATAANRAVVSYDSSSNVVTITNLYAGTVATSEINGEAQNLNAIRNTSLIKITFYSSDSATKTTNRSFLVNASSIVRNVEGTNNQLEITLRDTPARALLYAYIDAQPIASEIYLGSLSTEIMINENLQGSVDLIYEDFNPNDSTYIYNIFPNCKFNELSITMDTENFVQISVNGESSAPINAVSTGDTDTLRTAAINSSGFATVTNIFPARSNYDDSYVSGIDRTKYRLSVSNTTPHVPSTSIQQFEINDLNLQISNTTPVSYTHLTLPTILLV